MVIGCKFRLTVRIWLITLFNTMLKVIKTWYWIITPGVIKSGQKLYKLHRRTYDPFKYLWWNTFAKLPISAFNPQLIS